MAAPAQVSSTTATTGASTATSLTVNIPATTAGNLLVVCVINSSSVAASGVSDGLNGGYLYVNNSTAHPDAEMWYFPGTAAGVTSVTITYLSAQGIIANVQEVSGCDPVAPLDTNGTDTSFFTPSTAPDTAVTPTTHEASEWVAAVLGWESSSITISGLTAGYTNDAPVVATTTGAPLTMQHGYRAATAIGTFTYAGTLSSAVNWSGVIATFRAATIADTLAAPSDTLVKSGQTVSRASADVLPSLSESTVVGPFAHARTLTDNLPPFADDTLYFMPKGARPVVPVSRDSAIVQSDHG